MMNNTQVSGQVNEFEGRMVVELEVEQAVRQDQAPTMVLQANQIVEFDLFAEARRIYARARSGPRARSSSII